MVNVTLNTKTRSCIASTTFLGYEGENNANKLIFTFDDLFVDGFAQINIKRGTDKGYVNLTKVDETYELEVKASLVSQIGDVTFQLQVSKTDGTIYKYDAFVMTVKDALDTDAELPEEYPSWIQEANVKLAEMDEAITKANDTIEELITAKENGEFNGEDGYSPSAKVEPTESGALITITDKEGTTSVEVLHGSGGGSGEGGTTNYNQLVNKPKINNVELSGNKTLDQLGIQPKGNYLSSESDPIYSKDKPNIALKSEIPTKVSELTNDSKFASETYVDEEIAKFDFIKVVDALPTKGLSNRIYFVPKSDTQTQDLFDEYVWINEQWEWVTTKQIEVDLTDYVKNTDIATETNAGVITVNHKGLYGIGWNSTAGLFVASATESEIDKKVSANKAITPKILAYAVESVVGKHVTLTQAEYDALETKDENTFYYIVEEG